MKRLVIIISTLVLIVLIMEGYMLFNGTPWGKAKARNDTFEYLNGKYMQEMIVEKVTYSFKEGNYLVIAYPKTKPDLEFRVEYSKKSKLYYDNYFVVAWQDDIKTALQPVITKAFSIDSYVYVDIQSNPLYEQYKNNVSIVPNYVDVKERIKDFVHVRVSIERLFDATNADEEYSKMFDIVSFVRNKGFEFDSIDFTFGKDLNNVGKWVSFKLNYEDLMSISTKEDIVKYKE